MKCKNAVFNRNYLLLKLFKEAMEKIQDINL